MSKFLRYAAVGAAVASLGLASAAQAATTDSANTTATILTALSVDVDAVQDTLDFGTFADAGLTSDATFDVAWDGTGGTCPANLICAGPYAAPLFHITGLSGYDVQVSVVNATESLNYDISNPPAPGGTATTMSVGNFVTTDSTGTPASLFTLTSGSADFYLGGTLTVHPNMAAGLYTGTVSVSVAYN